MKKASILILFLFLCIPGFSQEKLFTTTNTGPNFVPPVQQNSVGVMMVPPISFLIDYDNAESNVWTGTAGGGYAAYIWPMNARYMTIDTAWNYGLVAFDSIYNGLTSTGYSSTSFSSIQVDSIIVRFGHENNSGTMDTIIASVIAVDANGYPNPAVVYATDTIFTTTGISILNNWTYNTTRKFYPTTVIPGNKFAVKIDYYGALTDTFGIVAGYGYTTGLCLSNPNYFYTATTAYSKISALPNPFFANSFSKWTQFGQQFPGVTGNNVTFQCAAKNYMQNINIGAYVTIDQTLGVTTSNDVTICEGRTTTITATALGGISPVTYQWAPIAGLGCSTCAVTSATPSGTATYTVSITDADTTVIDSVTVNIDMNIVDADYTYVVTNMQVKYTNTSQNATNYLWNFGSGATPATSSGSGMVTVNYSTGGIKTVKLRSTNNVNLCTDSISYDVVVSGVGIESSAELKENMLFQNFPNPFSDVTEIKYFLVKSSAVEFEITDITGRKIISLNEPNASSGLNSITLEGKQFVNGVYFYKIKTQDFSSTKMFVAE